LGRGDADLPGRQSLAGKYVANGKLTALRNRVL
jgi:hypothetical protein